MAMPCPAPHVSRTATKGSRLARTVSLTSPTNCSSDSRREQLTPPPPCRPPHALAPASATSRQVKSDWIDTQPKVWTLKALSSILFFVVDYIQSVTWFSAICLVYDNGQGSMLSLSLRNYSPKIILKKSRIRVLPLAV